MTYNRDLVVLSRHECLQLLESQETKIGRLALAGPRPLIMPINYALDHGEVVFRTAPGTKLDAAVKKGYVAFESDHIDPTWVTGWSVVIRGQSHVVEDPAEIERLSKLPLRPWPSGDKNNFVRIKDALVSGRRLF